ncbi:hypothetical protein [Streptomyces sp. CA-111067]|uniref:hypothetical protein n=1 Tax=Streptomyces sp. CA-111067 TaxID=3240046 RepID=UPI003D95D3AC
MDELTQLRDLRADAPTPGTARLAAGRWKVMAAAAAEAEGRPATAHLAAARSRFARSTWYPVSSRVRRTVLIAATAAAATAGVLVAQPRHPAGSGPETVAAVFDAAAANAAKSELARPAPDEWVLHDDAECSAGCGLNPQWVRGDGEKWVTPSSYANGKVSFRTSDTADVSAGGKWTGPLSEPNADWKMRFDPAGTYDAFSKLPTDPSALLGTLSTDPAFVVIPTGPLQARVALQRGPGHKVPVPEFGGSHSVKPALMPWMTPGEQFENIVRILQDAAVIPPKVNAALYRALALIPGTELSTAPTKDALGRVSTAIRIETTRVIGIPRVGKPGFTKSSTHFIDYLFLNPLTYAYQGYRQTTAGKDATDDSYARRTTAIVAEPGTVPGGAPWRPYKYPVR